MIAAILLPSTANAQFGGLLKKAKEKAKSTLGNSTGSLGNVGSVGNVASGVSSAARGVAPWPMASDQPSYNGKDIMTYLYNIADESEESVKTLHDQMFARYKANASILKADAGNMAAMDENNRFWRFYSSLENIVWTNVNNAMDSNGTLTPNTAYYLVTSRKGGGIGTFVMQKNGKFCFTTISGDGTFLDDADLKVAKEAALRMRRFQDLTYAIHVMLKEVGEECQKGTRVMYNLCGMYANAVEKAAEQNKPENIERKPRPKAGSMQASLKAQALQVAKAADKDVVDVIITSNSWDVKMKGLVPLLRNVYGYYLVKDEHGIMAVSRAWTQDYQGGGKYGKMRAGGVGTTSPFYIK